jgi:predicted transcriptional regulator
MKLTIKQLAEKTGQDYLVVTGVVKFLVSKGLAKEVDKVKAEGGKGKPSIVYEIPEKAELSF